MGIIIFSKASIALSTTTANKAAGIAPNNINFVLAVDIPRKIGSPKPPAPIRAAKVAVPMHQTAAVRRPAKIMGLANGNSTR